MSCRPRASGAAELPSARCQRPQLPAEPRREPADSSRPATADSGWCRTVTALIVCRSGRRCGGSKVAATARARASSAARRGRRRRPTRAARTAAGGLARGRARPSSRAARPGRAAAAPDRLVVPCPGTRARSAGPSRPAGRRSARAATGAARRPRASPSRAAARSSPGRGGVGADLGPRVDPLALRLDGAHRPCATRGSGPRRAGGRDLLARLLVDDAHHVQRARRGVAGVLRLALEQQLPQRGLDLGGGGPLGASRRRAAEPRAWPCDLRPPSDPPPGVVPTRSPLRLRRPLRAGRVLRQRRRRSAPRPARSGRRSATAPRPRRCG